MRYILRRLASRHWQARRAFSWQAHGALPALSGMHHYGISIMRILCTVLTLGLLAVDLPPAIAAAQDDGAGQPPPDKSGEQKSANEEPECE